MATITHTFFGVREAFEWLLSSLPKFKSVRSVNAASSEDTIADLATLVANKLFILEMYVSNFRRPDVRGNYREGPLPALLFPHHIPPLTATTTIATSFLHTSTSIAV